MSKNTTDELVELTDKHFPKGDKGRGQAMVLVAEVLPLISNREKLARIDELENLQGADMKLYTNKVITDRLTTLRKELDGGSDE